MIDSIFSFGELGFQEFETSRYCVAILRREGFQVEEGIAGIPTAWMATWGSGRPVISLGSDIDGLPKTSQKPGVAYLSPLIEGAPGHGEGHNSGVPLNVTAAIAVKRIMEREHIPGTLRIWPGVAEELLATKAFLVRAGYFKDVDVVLFAHVGSDLGVSYGAGHNNAAVSVEYSFSGRSAHSAVAPWRGRSALDAVELMDIGWNFRREHLRIQQRSHYVITSGGDQPNVVPSDASVWYYFREIDYAHTRELFETGQHHRPGCVDDDGHVGVVADSRCRPGLLTSTRPSPRRCTRISRASGCRSGARRMKPWRKAVQHEIQAPEKGLNKEPEELGLPVKEEDMRGGGSDDIGDVSWNVPTVSLSYPSNIPGLPGHNWANAISMATPIAHKGATAGAKVMAMTMIDLLLNPGLIEEAWKYFREVQTKDVKYTPFIAEKDAPAIDLNRSTMDRYRPEMRKYYFDPSRYKTYLEQLGITYPTVRKE